MSSENVLVHTEFITSMNSLGFSIWINCLFNDFIL
jgi:hypothetical protein